MTPGALRALIAGGESPAVEFKGEEREPMSENALVEAVVCLANRPDGGAGWILVGVDNDGRITRREAAELCRVSPDQAKRVLARLVDRGGLTQHGQRKGAFYELPSKYMGAPITAPKSRIRRSSE